MRPGELRCVWGAGHPYNEQTGSGPLGGGGVTFCGRLFSVSAVRWPGATCAGPPKAQATLGALGTLGGIQTGPHACHGNPRLSNKPIGPMACALCAPGKRREGGQLGPAASAGPSDAPAPARRWEAGRASALSHRKRSRYYIKTIKEVLCAPPPWSPHLFVKVGRRLGTIVKSTLLSHEPIPGQGGQGHKPLPAPPRAQVTLL